jgi:hypothetical protein
MAGATRRSPLPRDIDWWMVATNSLWVVGLSIVLSAFSYHDWLARATGRRFKQISELRSWRWSFSSGMFLTCLGWGLAQASYLWAQVLWIVVALSFAADLIRLERGIARRRGERG